MNLFLLLSVPLFTYIVGQFLLQGTDRSLGWKGLFGGTVSVSAIFLVCWFFRDGWSPAWDPVGLFFHYWVGEFLIALAPVLAFFLWWGPKGHTDRDFLAGCFYWLSGVFTVMAVRDFYVTMPSYDDFQLFLIPVWRLILMLALPVLFLSFFHSTSWMSRVGWAGVLVLVTGVTTALWEMKLLGWALVAWILTAALGTLVYFWVKPKYT